MPRSRKRQKKQHTADYDDDSLLLMIILYSFAQVVMFNQTLAVILIGGLYNDHEYATFAELLTPALGPSLYPIRNTVSEAASKSMSDNQARLLTVLEGMQKGQQELIQLIQSLVQIYATNVAQRNINTSAQRNTRCIGVDSSESESEN
eukprot:CAMPEP_0172489358 /NCGR_PEP_ID=MMETSP1066-20121228/19276_1 /TAXON_ID=671091 /ORGANISM="Coscinodiscus wailesii, Strain CCMP2513" /LENGTH=147 /DNA_ID=CAMNT_0013257133 /DNA_START=114 /DNA_END=557 /DNA_ORIENTATION=-